MSTISNRKVQSFLVLESHVHFFVIFFVLKLLDVGVVYGVEWVLDHAAITDKTIRCELVKLRIVETGYLLIMD